MIASDHELSYVLQVPYKACEEVTNLRRGLIEGDVKDTQCLKLQERLGANDVHLSCFFIC